MLRYFSSVIIIAFGILYVGEAAPLNTIYGPLTDDFTSWLNE